MSTLDVRVLGPLELRVDGAPVALGGPRQERVLAALTLRANRVVALDRLASAVWGDDPPESARRQVRNSVSLLRRWLGGRIRTVEPGYLLQLGPDECDLLRFDAAVAAARKLAGTEPAAAAAGFRAALGLWRGDALAGLTGPAGPTGGPDLGTSGLDERRLTAAETLFELELATGAGPELVAEITSVHAEHPLRERLVGQLMRALYRTGQQAAALAAYHALRERLVDALGVDPGAEVRGVYESLLQAEPGVPPESPPAGPVPDADLRGPTTGAGHGGAGHGEAAGAWPTVLVQMPADVTTFIGRDDHLAALDGPGTGGIVVIAGGAGVGKTALAVRWAHRRAADFPDGQLFVNLRGYTPTAAPLSDTAALSLLLRGLGVPASKVPVDVDDQTGLFRGLTAGRRMLLVLDNARDAGQVRPLLPGSPSVRVLITARDELTGLVALHDARLVRVGPLSADDSRTLLDRVGGAPLSAAAPAVRSELADLCGGLPLALRVAAAKLATGAGPVEEYVERLRADRFPALAIDGDPTATVRPVLRASYDALKPELRTMFRRLGLAPGADIAPAAAAALTGGSTAAARRTLDALAGVNLLERRPAERFRCHDLLRHLASELCREEDGEAERDTATARLLDHYLHSARAAARTVVDTPSGRPVDPHRPDVVPLSFTDAATAERWLVTELTNLVAIAEHAATRTDATAGIAWQLADVLRDYFWIRRHDVTAALSITTAGLRAAERVGDAPATAAMHLALGSVYRAASASTAALARYTTALQLYEQLADVAGAVGALGDLASVTIEMGDLDRGLQFCRRTLARVLALGDVRMLAAIVATMAGASYGLGRLEEAVDQAERAQRLYRADGWVDGEGSALLAVAAANLDLGRLDEAERAAVAARELFRANGSRQNECGALEQLAAVRLAAGDLDGADAYVAAGLDVVRETGNDQARGWLLSVRAEVLTARGDAATAVEVATGALALARVGGVRTDELVALLARAQARIGLWPVRPDPGLDVDLADAAGLAERSGRLLFRARVGLLRAEAHLARGETGPAAVAARDVIAVLTPTGADRYLARAGRVLAGAGGGPAGDTSRTVDGTVSA